MSKRCNCSVSKSIFCKNCSRYKMVINLKNGNDHLKHYSTVKNGFVNPVWYSVISKDHKPIVNIETQMLRRLAKSNLAGAAQIVQFRDNTTNELISEYKL